MSSEQIIPNLLVDNLFDINRRHFLRYLEEQGVSLSPYSSIQEAIKKQDPYVTYGSIGHKFNELFNSLDPKERNVFFKFKEFYDKSKIQFTSQYYIELIAKQGYKNAIHALSRGDLTKIDNGTHFFVGIYPNLSMNSEAREVILDNGDKFYVILINKGLILFIDSFLLLLFSVVYNKNLTSEDVEDVVEKIAKLTLKYFTNETDFDSFAVSILKEYTEENNSVVKSTLKKGLQTFVAYDFSYKIMEFIIFHEMAHVFNGHFEKKKSAKFAYVLKYSKVFNPNWTFEHEADLTAFKLLMLPEKNKIDTLASFDNYYHAIRIFFNIDLLLTWVYSLISGEKKSQPISDMTHPMGRGNSLFAKVSQEYMKDKDDLIFFLNNTTTKDPSLNIIYSVYKKIESLID